MRQTKDRRPNQTKDQTMRILAHNRRYCQHIDDPPNDKKAALGTAIPSAAATDGDSVAFLSISTFSHEAVHHD